MGRPRDGAEIQAETLLAMIAHRAGLKPTGKVLREMPQQLLCETEQEFRRRKRLLVRQAQELEAKNRSDAA